MIESKDYELWKKLIQMLVDSNDPKVKELVHFSVPPDSLYDFGDLYVYLSPHTKTVYLTKDIDLAVSVL